MPQQAEIGVRTPHQRRSRETHDRLLDATSTLLEEKDFEELTVQEIAARAGCSVGAFYGRFESKEAVLPRLLESHYAEMEREVDSVFRRDAWVDAPLDVRVSAVVDHLVSVARRQPGLIRTSFSATTVGPTPFPTPFELPQRGS